MITVPMREDGPDVDLIEELVAADPAIRACGACRCSPTPPASPSWEVVRRLVQMNTAAPDFRLFWDNACAVHTLTHEFLRQVDVLGLAQSGHPNRPLVFASTSKITFAGAGSASSAGHWATSPGICSTRARSRSGPTRSTNCGTKFFGDADGVRL